MADLSVLFPRFAPVPHARWRPRGAIVAGDRFELAGDMGTHFAFVSMPAAGHVTPTLPLVAVRAAGADPVPAPFVMPEGPPPTPGSSGQESPAAPRIEAFADSVEQTPRRSSRTTA